MDHNISNQSSKAGAPAKLERNLLWLAELESSRATVRQIADRAFITPGAVRKALKLARETRGEPAGGEQ